MDARDARPAHSLPVHTALRVAPPDTLPEESVRPCVLPELSVDHRTPVTL